MLSDWYACSVLRLTIRQTSEYLDTIEILRSPYSTLAQLAAAVNWLEGAEPALQLLALSPLLDVATTIRTDSNLAERTVEIYTDLLVGGDRTSDEDNSAEHGLAALVREAFSGPAADSAERLLTVVRRTPPKRTLEIGGRVGAGLYQDVHEHAAEIVALSLLKQAASQDPGAVGSCAMSPRSALLDDALANNLGRLPLLLAASVMCLVAPAQSGREVRGALADAGDGSGDLEPDLLSVLAQTWFGQATTGGTDPDLLEREIASGWLFQSWRAPDFGATAERARARRRLGVGGMPDGPLRTVLWQLTLWELAAAQDPARAAALTQRWWEPPGDRREHTSRTQRPAQVSFAWPIKSGTERSTVARWLSASARIHWNDREARDVMIPLARPSEPGADPSSACSPWLDRKDDRFALHRSINVSQRAEHSSYSRADGGLALLQLLVVISTARTLLRDRGHRSRDLSGQGSPDYDHLIALTFHCKDVLTDARLRFFLADLKSGIERPADLPVSPGIAALAWHVLRAVDRLGKGGYPEVPAAWFAEFLLTRSGTAADGKGLQWRRLFRAAALHGATRWIEDTASAVRDQSDSGGWFDGTTPYARRLLGHAVDQLSAVAAQRQRPGDQRSIDGSTSASAQILRQEFPKAKISLDPDWMSRLPELTAEHQKRIETAAKRKGWQATSPLTTRLLLAATAYPLELWRTHTTEIDNLVPDGAARTALATLRLDALLREAEPSGPDDVPSWLTEWFDLMSGVNDPAGWGRAARGLAIDMFDAPPGSHASQDRLRTALEVIIDNVVEFSANAPRYYQRLLEAMTTAADDAGPHAEGMDRLRIRTVHAIRRGLPARRALAAVSGPWAAAAQHEAGETIERVLRRFVAAAGSTAVAWDDNRPLGRAFVDSWRRSLAHPGVSQLDLPAGARADLPDPREVAVLVHDNHADTHQIGLTSRAVGRRHDGTTVSDLFGLDRAQRSKRLQQWRALGTLKNVNGVVCGVDDSDPSTQTVWVNWGSGEPLQVTCRADSERREVGELCVVAVIWSEGSWRAADPVSPLRDAARPLPVPGEIRAATVTEDPTTSKLTIAVDGVPGQIFRRKDRASYAEALLRWDPDLSRGFRALGSSADAGVDRTLARWDADLEHWLPVDRSLTELIAGDLPYKSPTGRPATVLVYVGAGGLDSSEEADSLRFATRPGRSFLLYPRDWVVDRSDLNDLLSSGPGTLIYVGLAEDEDPRLVVLPDPPSGCRQRWPELRTGTGTDLRNVQWLALFDSAEDRAWEAFVDGDEWIVDVGVPPMIPTAAGFPRRLAVQGLERASAPCLFHPFAWDHVAARLGEVAGEPLTRDALAGDLLTPTPDQFEFWWQPERSSTFTVSRFLGANAVRRGYAEAATTDGLIVRVDRDSLPFLVPTGGANLPAALEVRSVTTARDLSPGVAPLPLSGLADPASAPTGTDTAIRGIVVTVYRADGRLSGYDTWLCGSDGRPWRQPSIPVTAFSSPPQRAGTAFIGTWSDGGWHLTPNHRTIHTRALHRWRIAENPPPAPWRYLGPFHHRGTSYRLYAEPRGGQLQAVPNTPADGPPLGLSGRAVEVLGTGGFWGGVSHQRALVRSGSTELVGDVPDSCPVPGVIRYVDLKVTIQSDGLMWVRREFRTSSTGTQHPLPRKVQRLDAWREQVASGETVLVIGRLENRTLHADDYPLPLALEDAPFVAGVSYSDHRVAAVLIERDGELQASTRLVPPASADEFATEVGVPHGTVSRRWNLGRYVYYVGTETTPDGMMRRFEWGRGHTALLGNDELSVNGLPCDDELAFPLFHGDRLTSADFLVDADGRRIINIDPGQDVEIQTAGQVYQEARSGVVHRLLVAVDPRARTVRVRQVQLRRPRISDQEDQSQQQTIEAVLDDDSKQRILTAVASRPRTTAELAGLEVLARFDQHAYQSDRGRTRRFRYVESRFATPQNSGIGANEHLFMVAGEITRPHGNDTYIDFYLPDTVLQEPGSPALSVRMTRRQFSSREYLLAQLFEEGRQNFYKDRAVMLVQVRRRDDGSWSGDLTQAPPRDSRTLRGAVSHAGGSLLAVMSDGRGRRVELRPGVICELGQIDAPADMLAQRGALIRLSVSTSGHLTGALAQRPDRDYLSSETGRPTVLLPKQPLLRRGGIEKAGSANMFTVGRLPALAVTAGQDGIDLARRPHPRIVAIRAEHGRNTIDRTASAQIKAATIDCSGTDPIAQVAVPFGGRLAGDPETSVVAWAQLSYADADAAGIRERCATQWSYHDAKTGHWAGGSVVPDVITDRDISCEPVFFDQQNDQWSLRYRPESIDLFGGPGVALTERGNLPRSSETGSVPIDDACWYTVAYPAVRDTRAWGVWIEVSPGQVVEVGGPLLLGPGSTELDRLRWSHLGSGDELRLQPVKRNLVEPRRLRLLDWRPSPRSALLPPGPTEPGTDDLHALLPVAGIDAERGGLRLGAGIYTFDYPISRTEIDKYQGSAAVRLDRANAISEVASGPCPGDTALLGVSEEGRLSLLGFDEATVELESDVACWPGMGWLADRLRGSEARTVVTAMGGCVPVSVEHVENGRVTVSRRLQPTGHWPRNGLLRAEVTGADGHRLLLRSGGAIYRLPVRDVVRGVDLEHQTAAAEALASTREPVWIRLQSQRGTTGGPRVICDLSSPSAPLPYADEFDALALAVIEHEGTAVGLLLRSEHDNAYRWMAAKHTGWLSQPTPWELTEYLVKPGSKLRVRELTQARVSVVSVRAVQHQRNSLRLGTTLRVEPLGPAAGSTGSTWVGRINATGVLVRLSAPATKGENELAQVVGEPILAEVTALGSPDDRDTVDTVLSGSRRFPVDLPRRLTSGTPDAAAREQDRLAELQAGWWNEGLNGSPAGDPHEYLLRAAGTSVRSGQSDEPEIDDAVDRWLGLHGRDGFNLNHRVEMELAPLLAACFLLAQRGDSDTTRARGAVLLAHQIGLRAGRSLHVELIIRHWLPQGRPGGGPPLAAAARLAAVRLLPELEKPELLSAQWFGHGVLSRVGEGGPDDGSAPLAWAVLASVGQLQPGDEYLADAEVLYPLAGLGRALHPPKGDAVAQPSLTPAQRTLLGGLLHRALGFPIPLLPLPPDYRLDPAAAGLARAILDKT